MCTAQSRHCRTLTRGLALPTRHVKSCGLPVALLLPCFAKPQVSPRAAAVLPLVLGQSRLPIAGYTGVWTNPDHEPPEELPHLPAPPLASEPSPSALRRLLTTSELSDLQLGQADSEPEADIRDEGAGLGEGSFGSEVMKVWLDEVVGTNEEGVVF